MQREEGYYWVYKHNKWLIAEYEWGYWTLTGANSRTYNDDYFDLIDETPIER